MFVIQETPHATILVVEIRSALLTQVDPVRPELISKTCTGMPSYQQIH